MYAPRVPDSVSRSRPSAPAVSVMVAACAVLAGGCHTAPTPPKRMKMTTQIPDGVATPDRLKTSIGTLTSVDGVPDVQTTRLVYDNLDFQRATQAYLASLPIASMYAMREGLVSFGPANTTVVQFQQLMDSKALWLTPNTTSVYMAAWLEMTDEPWVIEAPPNVLGIIDDFWFRYVADFGNAGPDKGQGGKFLVLPPGYEGDVPAGYYVTQSSTYGNWVVWRGFQEEGDPAPAVEATKRLFRMYPLSKKDDPPQMTFVNASGVFHNTIHRMDEGIWEEIDAVVQAEPSEGMDPEILGQLASIGIRKGTPFAPDDRMRGILADAARVAAVTVRALAARPREDVFYFYPGESTCWMTPFVGGSHEFLADGVRLLDARNYFHFYATGITPAMASAPIGKGSQYAVAYMDSDGNPFDGGRTYKLHLPKDVPAKDFWSFTLYGNQTRALLQTDQQFPGIDNNKPGLIQNSDGSYDMYFGPMAPAGMEQNWIQTVPGKGWNVILRLYGPLEPWFDKTWRPGDFELVE